MRNHNWGNVEKSNRYKWKGEISGLDSRFCTFKDPIYGLRAIIKITNTYYYKYKIKSIVKWVGRWAPSFENDTNAYAEFLIKATGSLEINVEDKEMMREFVKAVCIKECGWQIKELWIDWYFDRAWDESK